MLLIWIIIFIVALVALVKGADWLLAGAEKIGLATGLSPFIVGALIVGVGTSFPELITSIAAILKNASEIVVANAVGSNLANILLVIGFCAVVGGKLFVSKSLIDLDIPLLVASAILILGVAWDGQITFGESILLLAGYISYFLYSILHKSDETVLSETKEKPSLIKPDEKPKLKTKDFVLLILGIIGVALGAKYLIDAVVEISSILNIATGIIAITAVAIGTSLPELMVSIKAVLKKKSEVAIGNIFGSNIFNTLVVVGIPGLFGNLAIDHSTLTLGLPMMAAATLIFAISGISRKIYIWEGMFYLCLYVFFLGKLFSLF